MTKKTDQNVSDENSTYLLFEAKTKKSNRMIEAICEQTSEGFVVLEGSQVDEVDSPAIPASLKELRMELIKSNVIKDGVLQEKQLFSSPSDAVCFCTRHEYEWSNGLEK
ncbi:MAG: DUF4357 domain-containing protein [Streptococcus parasanguinis]